MRRRLFAAAVLVASVLSGAEAVAAHADPSIVTPAACSTAIPGDVISVQFTEELRADGSRLELSIDGVPMATAGIDLTNLNHDTIVVAIPDGVTGAATVTWESLSAVDDDTASGSYGFAIGSSALPADCEMTSGAETDDGLPLVVIGGLTVVVGAGLALAASRRRDFVEA